MSLPAISRAAGVGAGEASSDLTVALDSGARRTSADPGLLIPSGGATDAVLTPPGSGLLEVNRRR